MLIFYHDLLSICLLFLCCLCVCVFLCHGVYRQTASVILAINSSLLHWQPCYYTSFETTLLELVCRVPRSMLSEACMYVYMFVTCLFAFLGIPDSWWSNSLFVLDTGLFICPATSCRPCHPTFLPGFHRFGECACLTWLSTEILCLSASVDYLTCILCVSVF